MRPLKITFELAGEVAEMSHPLHLDGLLAYCVTQENNGDWQDITLPLAYDGEVPKASAIDFERDGNFVLFRSRRFDRSLVTDLLDHPVTIRARYIYHASNENKDYVLSNFIFRSTYAECWCVGDKDKISYLLNRYITSLGPLMKLGYGKILKITITEDKQAEKNWMHRILPFCPNEGEYYPIHAPASFPYWDRKRAVDAWIHHAIC